MSSSEDRKTLKLVLPKGRIQERVMGLLNRVGLSFRLDTRSYRPLCSDPSIEVKLLKPQNIPTLVSLGRHDCGFTGLDWVREQQAHITELLDLGFDPVRIVSAVPEGIDLKAIQATGRPVVVASEYQHLASDYITKQKLNAVLIKTYGATEALPPEDADMIIDNTATGSTLKLNRLVIQDELMCSTTRFIALPEAMTDPWKAEKLNQLVMLMQSVLRAEDKVLLEMNVSEANFEGLVAHLPAMRSPTISPLYQKAGYAVKIAVPSKEVPHLVPILKANGAQDILEYKLEKIVI